MKPKLNYKTDTHKFSKIDFCETPFYAVEPLFPYIPKHWVVWESADGNGNISREFTRMGYHVIGSDIQRGTNFFEFSPGMFNVQITNPPYGIKYEWLARSYELEKPFALLLPVETLGAAKAQVLFDKYDVQIIFLSRRVDFKMPDKGWASKAQFPTAWFTYGLSLPKDIMFYDLIKPNEMQVMEYYAL